MRWAGSLAVMTLPDEVDLVNIGELRAGLDSLIRAAPTVVVVDMTRTTFCDSAGVATLVRAAQRASSAGIRLRLAGSGPVLRVLRLLGADRIIAVHPSLTAALGEVAPHGAPGAGLGSSTVPGQADEGGQASLPR